MRQATTSRQVHLAKRDMLSLDADARQVTCESGSLWITQDRDTRDILLEPGDRFAPDRGRCAIVYALSPAVLTVLTVRSVSPASAPAPTHARATRAPRHTLVLE